MLHYNYLIVGSGLAGLFTALRASHYGSVAIVTKSNLSESNSYFAQGGIASVIGEDDLPIFHYTDTIKAGRELCNHKAVQILVNEGPLRVAQLIKEGMKFDKDNSGLSYELGLEGGHHKRRILHAGGDITGQRIVEFLTEKVKESKNITLFENHKVIEIIEEQKVCYGLRVWDAKTGKEKLFMGEHTILAMGGASAIYQRSTNPSTTVGDGVAICYNIGCQIADMEFIQFHPTVFSPANGPSYLISEAVRGDGAYLINSKGERFMTKVDPLAELAPRDLVAREIYRQKEVYLSLSHLDPKKVRARFPNIYHYCAKQGLDLTKQIPVSPAAHYMIGGVKTDFNGETNIQRLYVCGELASTGIMGANRLASNSLAECLVFGYRAVEQSLKASPVRELPPQNLKYSLDNQNIPFYSSVREETAQIMSNSAGIIRDRELLNDGYNKIVILQRKVDAQIEESPNTLYLHFSKNLLIVAALILRGAIEREESRGAHFREDFPNEDKRNLYHTIQCKNNKIKRDMINRAENLTRQLITLAIEEDTGSGDITTNSLIPLNSLATATLTAKKAGVISGLEAARLVFEHFDSQVVFKRYKAEGAQVKEGEEIAQVRGNFRALLTGERTALNILQRMSGIATQTANYVDKLKGTKTLLLDTRKTSPGMRHLDKMAVAAGGGENHRIGLYDMVLIKDNHIKVAGGIIAAVEQIKRSLEKENRAKEIKIEVETSNLKEVGEAVEAGADIVMLDNMDTDTMKSAVNLIAGKAKTEASGNITLENIGEVALTGVDYISVGALTHSVKALDISMNIKKI